MDSAVVQVHLHCVSDTSTSAGLLLDCGFLPDTLGCVRLGREVRYRVLEAFCVRVPDLRAHASAKDMTSEVH